MIVVTQIIRKGNFFVFREKTTFEQFNHVVEYVNHVLHVQNIVMNKLKTFVNVRPYCKWDSSNGRRLIILNQISILNSHSNNILKSDIVEYNSVYTPTIFVDGKSEYQAEGLVVHVGRRLREEDLTNVFAMINGTIIKLLETDKAWYDGIFT